MAQQKVDLTTIFQAVTQELAKNQPALDQADEYNHNHGSNMVQTFQTVTNALEKKKGASSSAALGYAAKTLAKQANSGSSQLYAQHLAQAAAQFKGKRVDEKGALDLLQTLIGAAAGGGAQAAGPGSAPAGGDLLGSLLGGMLGGETQSQPAVPSQGTPQAASGDLLGSLLGGLTGGASQEASQPGGGDLLGALLGGLSSSSGVSSQSGSGQPGGLNLSNLLQAGMAYMQATQGGASTMDALVQALAAGSGMGNSRHRSESTQVVVSAFLQALAGMKK